MVDWVARSVVTDVDDVGQWPGYFPQEIAVKIPADHKVKSSDEVTWVAMKLAEIVNEILVVSSISASVATLLC